MRDLQVMSEIVEYDHSHQGSTARTPRPTQIDMDVAHDGTTSDAEKYDSNDDSTEELIEERSETHGDIEDTFPAIAEAWSAYLRAAHDADIVLSGDEVADLMVLLKLLRKASGGYHADHYDDAKAYAGIGDRLARQ